MAELNFVKWRSISGNLKFGEIEVKSTLSRKYVRQYLTIIFGEKIVFEHFLQKRFYQKSKWFPMNG